MDVISEVRLGRHRSEFIAKLASYGISLNSEAPEGQASNLSVYRWLGGQFWLSSWDTVWTHELPRPVSEFKNQRHWNKHLRQLAGCGDERKLVEHLAMRLRRDHYREVHLPMSLCNLASRAAAARSSLTQLCRHPDSPSEAAVVLAHARMVEERVHERLWEIADLPAAGYRDADVTVLKSVLDELEVQTTEAVRLCAISGSVMLAGVDADASLLACLRSESILAGEPNELV